MDDRQFEGERAEIGGTEYRFVERLTSVQDSDEIVVCVDESGARRYASEPVWVKGRAAFREKHEVAERAGASVVTAASPSAKKLALFRSLFVAREDVHAKSYFNKKTSRIGYAPACANEWRRGVCGKLRKPPVKCADCAQRCFLALDDATLLAHFRGGERDGFGVVAVYPLIDDDQTRLLVVDFDKGDWRRAAGAFWDVCDRKGVPVALERSRSGNGAHAWVFFSEQVEASLARKLGCALLTEAMETDLSVGFDSYDRLFPSQDSAPHGGFGNAIALPFQGAAMRSGNTVFVDKSFEPWRDQWRFLSGVGRMTSGQLDEALRRFGKRALGDLADADAADRSGLLVDDQRMAVKGQTTAPWARRSRAKLGLGDVPAEVRCVRSNMLYVAKEGLSPAAINRIRRLAAFGNPEFYRVQAMRQPVYGKPRVLHFDEDADEWIGLPRGCEEAVLDLVSSLGARVSVEDKRCEGRPVSVEFVGELRPGQVLAVEELARYDMGVLVAPTAFGKTVVGANLIARFKMSALVLVPRVALLKQWQERLGQFLRIDEELPELLTPTGRKSRKKRSLVGQIGGGKRLPSGIVDIALVPALFEEGDIPGEKRVSEFVASYGMVICDECHHVSAVSFEKVMRTVKARRVYGLTATPKRSDGLQAISFMQCGPVRYRADAKEKGGFSRIMVPRFTKTRLEGVDQENFTQLVEGLGADAARNDLIVRDVACALERGETSLVLTRKVDHAVLLEERLRSRGCRTALLVGSDPRKIKQEKLDALGAFDRGEPFAIVATGSYIGEGFDDDRLDTLFLAAPVAWSGLVAQYVGRLHREREGKREVVVYDYVDVNVRMLDRMYRKRLKAYASQGYELRPARDEEDVRGEFVLPDAFGERCERDVGQAAGELLVASAEVHKRRIDVLLPHLKAAVGRGVRVRALLPCVEGMKPRRACVVEGAAEELRQAGIDVGFCETCPNLTIVDGQTVWYGGIGAFAFPRAEEQVLRFASAEVACELAAELWG